MEVGDKMETGESGEYKDEGSLEKKDGKFSIFKDIISIYELKDFDDRA